MSVPVPRYVEVARLAHEGLTVPRIAEQLDLTPSTVYAHLAQARRIYGPNGLDGEPWENEARRMAAVYPDDERRQWIFKEMERWSNK